MRDNFPSAMFFTLLERPLINALIAFYNTIAFHDLGLAIILLTLFIRLLLFPLFHKSARHQMIMQHLQPKLKEIQREHKDDKAKQTEKMMALYAEHGINPFSSILFLVIQIPILIALYRIFLKYLTPESFGALYSFIAHPAALGTTFLGLINLSKPSILMVALAALAQYAQMRLTLVKRKPNEALSPTEKINRNMMFVSPVLTFVIFYRLPSAIGLYWLTTSLFSIVQQIIVNRDLARNPIKTS